MVGTWTSAILASIGHYGRNLDIGNFGWKQLLWPKPRHAILTKRDTHVAMGKEIAKAQDQKIWKDEKTEEKMCFFLIVKRNYVFLLLVSYTM
jgi:hypothetical protein